VSRGSKLRRIRFSEQSAKKQSRALANAHTPGPSRVLAGGGRSRPPSGEILQGIRHGIGEAEPFPHAVASRARLAVQQWHTNRRARSARTARSVASNSADSPADPRNCTPSRSTTTTREARNLRNQSAGQFGCGQRIDLPCHSDHTGIATLLGNLQSRDVRGESTIHLAGSRYPSWVTD
jgi:hypothetical protein